MDNGEDPSPILEEICHDTRVWVPQVNENVIPKLGMSFSSLNEGRKFYDNYAKGSGFGLQNSTTTYDKKTKDLTSQMFVCWKEGFYVSKEKNTDLDGKRRKRRLTREGCRAMIRIKKETNDVWLVAKFVEEHNHPLTSPNKTHLISSHRQLTPVKKALFEQYRKANIGTSKIVEVLGIRVGGYDKIGCTERDLRNYERDDIMKERLLDAQTLLDRLQSEHEINLSFNFAYEVDDEKKLTHLFWADGIARKLYAHFGDVVVFDTTYDTNQYSMILAPFTGVNHHGKSTIFGCGLLKDEKTNSFIWLFHKFIDVMSGKHPKAIITDQDPAMGASIRICLPTTYHRFCMWHIMKKCSEKLGATFQKNDFRKDFKSGVYNSQTPEEFESHWVEMVDKYQLQNNDWLCALYDIRDKWIPAYSKDIFLAGMRSTQRSESMNAFFDCHLSRRNSLVEFYSHYEMAVKKQRYRQLEADNRSKYTKPHLKTRAIMERQMGDIYTAEIFNIFQMNWKQVWNVGHAILDMRGLSLFRL